MVGNSALGGQKIAAIAAWRTAGRATGVGVS